MRPVCTPSLSSMALSVATPSVFSLCWATWSSEPLTSAVTPTMRCVRIAYTTVLDFYCSNYMWHTIIFYFQDDEVFTFNFSLIVTHEEKKVAYALNKTCSPALPWAPREVTCEVNYMEVSSFTSWILFT